MSSGELRRTFESRYLTGTFQLLNSWTPSLSYFFFDTVQRFNISAYKIDKVCNAFVKCLELKVKFWTFYTFWLFDLNLVVLVYRSKMTKSKHLWPDCINTQQPSGFVSGRVWKHWQIKPLWKGSSQSSFKLLLKYFCFKLFILLLIMSEHSMSQPLYSSNHRTIWGLRLLHFIYICPIWFYLYSTSTVTSRHFILEPNNK